MWDDLGGWGMIQIYFYFSNTCSKKHISHPSCLNLTYSLLLLVFQKAICFTWNVPTQSFLYPKEALQIPLQFEAHWIWSNFILYTCTDPASTPQHTHLECIKISERAKWWCFVGAWGIGISVLPPPLPAVVLVVHYHRGNVSFMLQGLSVTLSDCGSRKRLLLPPCPVVHDWSVLVFAVLFVLLKVFA